MFVLLRPVYHIVLFSTHSVIIKVKLNNGLLKFIKYLHLSNKHESQMWLANWNVISKLSLKSGIGTAIGYWFRAIQQPLNNIIMNRCIPNRTSYLGPLYIVICRASSRRLLRLNFRYGSVNFFIRIQLMSILYLVML